MKIETHLPLVEEILSEWKTEIGRDYAGYKNHVYRMINFCFAQDDFSEVEREKIMIAGCFHDIGIWAQKTFDYLLPSMELAQEYLVKNHLETWIPEINLMIGQHHKLRKYKGANPTLIEIFRRGDLVDFSLGLVKCGLPKTVIKAVRKEFPNAGFHQCLVRVAGRWGIKHPLNPAPMIKW